MANILVVEDHEASLQALVTLVRDEGHEAEGVADLAGARRALDDDHPDLVLCDLLLPDGEGLELLEHEDRDFELVLITGEASVESAIAALRRGAMDYLTKPLDIGRLRALLTQFERTKALRTEVSVLREELERAGRFGSLVGSSDEMRSVYRLIDKVAGTDATVFITGESGTGKEVVAQTVHDLSRRSNKAMLPINCGAVSPTLIESELFGHEKGSFTGASRRHLGHFERADEGTLFLDEITEMPLELQVKLLRVLETRTFRRVGGTQPVEVDVRVIAASNRRPREAIEEGEFREDLFYRLNVFPIHLPPLRERTGDVERLARHFVEQIADREQRPLRLGDDALEALDGYSWPGNVRELKNTLERAAILADERIGVAELPHSVCAGEELAVRGRSLQIPIGTPIEEAERRLILATLADLNDSRKDTASALGISQKTLYNRLKSYEQSDQQPTDPTE